MIALRIWLIYFVLIALAADLAGCATLPADNELQAKQQSEQQSATPPSPEAPPVEARLTEPLPAFDDFRPPLARIDYPISNVEPLSPTSKNFDLMGYVESVIQNEYYVSIHFILMCRDVEDSVYQAIDSNHMKPLGNRAINWSLKDQAGVVVLDENGYGQIQLMSMASQKTERLRLASNNEVLYVQAGDIGRIVTPPDWCL